MYKISIVVSTHNRSEFLKESIASYPKSKNIEILIMENGSSKKEVLKYKEITDEYENVKLINLKVGNLPASRNAGVLAAKGEYIFLIDDDDWITKEFSEYLINFNGNKNIYRFPYKRYKKIKRPTSFGKIREKSIFKVIEVSTWLTKRDFILKHNIRFNENFWWAEDQFFAAKMFDTLEKQWYVNINSIIYDFLDNDNSMVRMPSRKVDQDFKIFKFLGETKFDILVRQKQLRTSIKYFKWGAYNHEIKKAFTEIEFANRLLSKNKKGFKINKLKKRL